VSTHHPLQPKRIAQALGDSCAIPVGAVERLAQILEELRPVAQDPSANLVKDLHRQSPWIGGRLEHERRHGANKYGLGDARRFLTRHREALSKRPVAIFAMGPFNNDEKEWQGVRAQLDKELAMFPWLTPVAHEVFGGKFDPAKLRFPYNLVPYLKRLPASDIRDWTTIRAWASSMADKVQRT